MRSYVQRTETALYTSKDVILRQVFFEKGRRWSGVGVARSI